MEDKELQMLHEQLKELEEKHQKFQKDLKDAIDQGDGLHDNALWQSAQDRFSANLERIERTKRLINEKETALTD